MDDKNDKNMESIGKHFIDTAVRRLKYYKELAEKTFAQLDDEQLHYQPNAASMNIAMIVQHMAGNMLSRWTDLLTTDGEKEWRKRDAEFEDQGMNRQQLLDEWQRGWSCFIGALESLEEQDLLKTISIRQEPLTVMDAINRQLAHYPYHIGQVVYIGKILKDGDWKSLSIPKGQSAKYNASKEVKDPAKRF